MEAVYHDSSKYIRFTAGADLESGQVLAFGTGVSVVEVGCVSGQECNAAIQGAYYLPKPTGASTARAVGTTVGFNTTARTVVDVAGADLYAGRVLKAATDDDDCVLVGLNLPAAESLA